MVWDENTCIILCACICSVLVRMRSVLYLGINVHSLQDILLFNYKLDWSGYIWCQKWDGLGTTAYPIQRSSSTSICRGNDFRLWIERVELYMREAGISEGKIGQELVSLLEDEPFRMG